MRIAGEKVLYWLWLSCSASPQHRAIYLLNVFINQFWSMYVRYKDSNHLEITAIYLEIMPLAFIAIFMLNVQMLSRLFHIKTQALGSRVAEHSIVLLFVPCRNVLSANVQSVAWYNNVGVSYLPKHWLVLCFTLDNIHVFVSFIVWLFLHIWITIWYKLE